MGGVAGGRGRENELKRAFVSRIWTGSRPVAALGYLLGGGALRGWICWEAAGVTAPEEAHPEMVLDKKKKEGKRRR